MAKQKPNTMIKVGDLKNVVTDLKTRNEDLSSQYEQTTKDIASGMTRGQSGVGELQRTRKREMIHNASKIDRYGGLIQGATIMHDKARLAEKEAQYKKDYPLAATYKQAQLKAPAGKMMYTQKIVKKK
jgi:hypothetical protein